MAHIPRLEVLNLQLGEMAILPDSFLANAAQLASLTLEANYLTELSAGFLASLPQLSRLDMAYHLQALPDSFMARAPRLQQICLLAESLWPVSPHCGCPTCPDCLKGDCTSFASTNCLLIFLAFVARISKLYLILSLDIPLEPPQGHLGELLARHGTNIRTTVGWPDVLNVRKSPGVQPDNLTEQVSEISDIYVMGH